MVVGFWAPSRRDRDPEAQEPRLNPFPHAGPDELPPRPEGRDTKQKEAPQERKREKRLKKRTLEARGAPEYRRRLS